METMKVIGTKILEASPITLGDYNEYRGWTIPNDENPDDKGYLVKDDAGHETFIPEETLYRDYGPVYGMTFGLAIEAMKKGEKVARAGWNGKGMWISITNGQNIHASKFWNKNNRDFAFDNGDHAEVLPVITMKTADDKILMGWNASTPDVLADDWQIV